jgi:hypothetical protein
MAQAVTRRRPPVPVPQKVPALVRPPMSADAQWARLNAVIVGSVDRAQGISSQHSLARDQLDAAAYALQVLLADLSTVMHMPARSLRRSHSDGVVAADFALAA